jgi:hypothetical protein
LVVRAVVKLGGARTLVRSHGLCIPRRFACNAKQSGTIQLVAIYAPPDIERRARLLGLDAPQKLDISAFYRPVALLADNQVNGRGILEAGGNHAARGVSLQPLGSGGYDQPR